MTTAADAGGGEQARGHVARTLHVFAVVGRNPALRRVELALATFNAGEWATWLAMLVYAYDRGGVTESGIVATVMLTPAALFAPFVASLGERHPPGRTLLGGYVAQAVACGTVAAALLAHAPALVAYALMALPSVAFTVTRPAQAGFAPGLARAPEELTATNVVSGWIESVCVLAAPALAGAVLAFSTPGAVFALCGAGCALGAVLVAPVRNLVGVAAATAEDGEPGGVRAGLAFVRREPTARLLLILLAAECVATGALDVLCVELARGVLHRGGDWAGYLTAAFGAGGVVAIAVTARLVGVRRLALPLVISIAIWSAAFAGLAVVPGVIGAIVLLAVGGGARTTFDVSGRTLLQRVGQPDLLARIFGLLEGLQMAGYAIGSLLAPVLVALHGPSVAFVALGALLPLAGALAGRRMLELDRSATVPVVEIALLRSTPILAPLPPPALEARAHALVPRAAAAGTEVIRQGDVGDRFYVIADGELDVLVDGVPVAALGRSDSFGEIALLADVPRTATVRARGDVRLYALERETFLAAVTGQHAARTRAQELVDTRLGELHASRHGEAAAPLAGAVSATAAPPADRP